MHLKDDHSTVQDDHSSKHNEEYHTYINDTNDSEDKNQDESDRPSQLNNMNSNNIVNQGYKVLLPMGPGKYTSISVKYNETTNTSTFPQDITCHLQSYIYNCAPTIVSTCITKERSSTVISTRIFTKYFCTHISTDVSMEYIPTTPL